MSYPDVPNPDLLDRIPLSARVVLDVGCGGASLSAAYRRRNPRARLLGIEFDRAMAGLAIRRLDRLYEVDVEAEPLPFAGEIPGSGIDCLVYGDVLEHLRDPWAVLARQVEALAADGTVLLCLPNVEHWSFVERILRGAWDYDDAGLFDRTHLRWFNPDTTLRDLRAAGLVPFDVKGRVFDAGQAEAFADALRPGLERLRIDPAAYAARSRPLQHVWRAHRRPVIQVSVVATRLTPVGGVSEVRVDQPLAALYAEPGMVPRVVALTDVPALAGETPRVMILHRPLLDGDAGRAHLRRILAMGYVVVCEFDDHPDFIPALRGVTDLQNFSGVHAVQTTTEPLAEVLRRRNPEVAVFANAVAAIPDPVNFVAGQPLTLFFAGLNREADWPALVPALNDVAAEVGERLRFRIVADAGLFEALRTPHKEYAPIVDYRTYLGLLAGGDVSFMPLADTVFNRCKSDLKFIEAAAHRVTPLASRTVYAGSIEDGATGFLFTDGDELRLKLRRLVEDPAHARAMADAARSEVIRTRMLAYQMAARAAWYRDLWARRFELHAALLARAPELRSPEVDAAWLRPEAIRSAA